MYEIEQSRAFGAERAAIDRVIRITFDVNDAGLGILGAIAEAVHQDSATDGAVGAGVAGFDGARQFIAADLRQRGRRRKSHQRQA
jgi:hypothetical protein